MSGHAVLITGSGRGIGRAIALALAREGFAVAINGPVMDQDIETTLEELNSIGAVAAPVIGDVADIDGHDALLDQAEEALGPLTTLVNNAGVSVMNRGDLLDVSPESYDRCQSVNTRGAFFLTQAWAKRVVRRKRDPALHHSVITVSSSNAQAASINRGEYCISKTGASMLAKLFAVRLGPEDIGSYEIQPGVIETAMTAPAQDTYRKRIEEGLTATPRMGQPSDVASVATAMATGRFSYCTGQSVQVDGGLLISRF